MNSEILAVGLDVGTSHIRCVIGEPSEDGKLNVLGVGEADSKGLRRGIVTSAASTRLRSTSQASTFAAKSRMASLPSPVRTRR
ncbi:MAG: hypothetical protein IPP63_16455 [Chloracidobacterium sp.]|nr:hypothetical protein [Chloracidobacterium sp.]